MVRKKRKTKISQAKRIDDFLSKPKHKRSIGIDNKPIAEDATIDFLRDLVPLRGRWTVDLSVQAVQLYERCRNLDDVAEAMAMKPHALKLHFKELRKGCEKYKTVREYWAAGREFAPKFYGKKKIKDI